MIDNIERNIMATVAYVEQANIETKAAVVYQSKARRVSIKFSKKKKTQKLTFAYCYFYSFFDLLFIFLLQNCSFLYNEKLSLKKTRQEKKQQNKNFTFFFNQVQKN